MKDRSRPILTDEELKELTAICATSRTVDKALWNWISVRFYCINLIIILSVVPLYWQNNYIGLFSPSLDHLQNAILSEYISRYIFTSLAMLSIYSYGFYSNHQFLMTTFSVFMFGTIYFLYDIFFIIESKFLFSTPLLIIFLAVRLIVLILLWKNYLTLQSLVQYNEE